MVHAITIFECPKCNGRDFSITYDSNECGCHHDGIPCVMVCCMNFECYFQMTFPITKEVREDAKKHYEITQKGIQKRADKK